MSLTQLIELRNDKGKKKQKEPELETTGDSSVSTVSSVSVN